MSEFKIFDILTDPKKYEGKIKELQRREDSIDAKLKTIKNASQIDVLHERAKKLSDEAAERLRVTNKEIDTRLQAALEEAESVLQNAQKRADSMLNNATQKEREAKKLSEKLTKQAIEQNKYQTKLDVTNEAQVKRENELQRRENQVKAKESILKQLEQA